MKHEFVFVYILNTNWLCRGDVTLLLVLLSFSLFFSRTISQTYICCTCILCSIFNLQLFSSTIQFLLQNLRFHGRRIFVSIPFWNLYMQRQCIIDAFTCHYTNTNKPTYWINENGFNSRSALAHMLLYLFCSVLFKFDSVVSMRMKQKVKDDFTAMVSASSSPTTWRPMDKHCHFFTTKTPKNIL